MEAICINCGWHGPLDKCVVIQDCERCPDCGAPVELPADEPLVLGDDPGVTK